MVKREAMKKNNPTLINSFNNILSTILSSVSLENYFTLDQDKKNTVLYTVLNLLKNNIKPSKIKQSDIDDEDFKKILAILCKGYEENENYEVSALLNDIKNNYEKLNETINNQKKTVNKLNQKIEN